MPHSRRQILGLLTLAPIAAATGLPAFAKEPETFQIDGLAIRGYDPVGYFTNGAPVKGIAAHSLDHNGATWQFANAANMASFQADPEKYGARYGGYCAWAVSRGYIAPTIPEAWTIHEDRLYLNATLRVHRRWSRNIPENIARADANWPGVLN